MAIRDHLRCFAEAEIAPSSAISDVGSITVTATYDYSTPQIPEPLGVAVMASGLMGLGFLRFRRSR